MGEGGRRKEQLDAYHEKRKYHRDVIYESSNDDDGGKRGIGS